MNVTIIKKDAAEYAIKGELNMQTVPDAVKQLNELMGQLPSEVESLTFDLDLISRSDSAGVALLIDVMQKAQSLEITLLFSNLPQQMRDIADISGLLDILPISKN